MRPKTNLTAELLVIDDKIGQIGFKNMLPMGFEVEEADSGAAGLKLLEHLVPACFGSGGPVQPSMSGERLTQLL